MVVAPARLRARAGQHPVTIALGRFLADDRGPGPIAIRRCRAGVGRRDKREASGYWFHRPHAIHPARPVASDRSHLHPPWIRGSGGQVPPDGHASRPQPASGRQPVHVVDGRARTCRGDPSRDAGAHRGCPWRRARRCSVRSSDRGRYGPVEWSVPARRGRDRHPRHSAPRPRSRLATPGPVVNRPSAPIARRRSSAVSVAGQNRPTAIERSLGRRPESPDGVRSGDSAQPLSRRRSA